MRIAMSGDHTVTGIARQHAAGQVPGTKRKRLSMCNPANETEIRACVDAGIDTLTVWDDQVERAREIAPTHFTGTAMNWGQRRSSMCTTRARSCGVSS